MDLMKLLFQQDISIYLALAKKLASSQRYGYLFENEKMWIAEPHVQMYLDSISKTLPTFEQNVMANQPKEKKGYSKSHHK